MKNGAMRKLIALLAGFWSLAFMLTGIGDAKTKVEEGADVVEIRIDISSQTMAVDVEWLALWPLEGVDGTLGLPHAARCLAALSC